MKNHHIIFSWLLLLTASASGQQGTLDRIKGNTLLKLENKASETIERGIDSMVDGSRSQKKGNKKAVNSGAEQQPVSSTKTTTEGGLLSQQQETPKLKAYSKFDFVPGERVLYYDDFERVAVGDFPAEYNTDASGEVMTIEGKPGKWLSLTKNGSFIPEKITSLPDNFTLEMSVGILNDPGNNMSGLGFHFNTDKEQLFDYHFSQGSFVTLHPAGGTAAFTVHQAGSDNPMRNEFKVPQWDLYTEKSFARLSFWRQGSRLRLYVNENKLMDIPRFFTAQKPYQLALFRDFFGDCNLMITDIRLAAALPDTRSKLITDGRFSTTGILFEFQKSSIRPESYQVLKNIAATLQENPTVRVNIVGHTSNDGDAAANLTLSKQRAAAVKQALVSEFGIATDRLQTDGKGGAEPADKGSTPEAKANNRRVEFIKL